MTRAPYIVVGLAILYVVLGLVGLSCGHVFIPPHDVLQCLLGGGSDTHRLLVIRLGLPQMLLLGVVGAALACSGATLQATFNNPLADPGVLGISAGASFAAVLAIHLKLTQQYFFVLPAAAFLGALAVALVIYGLAFLGGRPTLHGLLLTGLAVGSLAGAGVSFVLTLMAAHGIQELLFWLLGGVNNASWEHVELALPAVVIGVAGMLSLHRPLDAMLLGEEQALAMGVPVTATRLQVLALTALATGAAVAVSGGIAFIGLMVPHLVRRLVGPRALYLLPACVTGGAAFLTGCELLTRLSPVEFPLKLGVVTAFLGAPAFLILLRREEGRRS